MRSMSGGGSRLGPASAAGVLLALVVAAWPCSVVAGDPESARSAKSWIGREAEFESFLKTAEPVALGELGTGVTNPFKAELAPGGPIPAFVWKPITPGFYGGFYESYKTEVAAYELDKLLRLGMVPVTVERRVDRATGAACMWVAQTQSFKELGGPPKPPAEQVERWNIQIIRAKMFDNLISNRDPNLGNWLVDPAWNVILIDHSRSFGGGKAMAHEMTRIDADLWARMRALDETSLSGSVGRWLNRKQIRSILKRRDRMEELILELVEGSGEHAVLIRYDEPVL